MSSICAALLVQAIAGGSIQQSDLRPVALQMLHADRSAIKTATLSWSRTDYADAQPRRIHFQSRIGGPDLLLSMRGDDEGVISRTADGKPAPVSYGPVNVLICDGDLWTHADYDVFAEVEPTARGYQGTPDPRTFGLAPVMSFETLDDTVWLGGGDPMGESWYEEYEEQGRVVVVWTHGDDEVTYWIEPEHGWNPVRVVHRAGDRLVAEMRCELENFDGHWFPRRMEFFNPSFADGARPAEVIVIDDAAFNRPSDPPRLGPADIRVDVGTSIHRYGPERRNPELAFWDGQKLISQEEYFRRLGAGELHEGDMHREALRYTRALTAERERTSTARPERWFFLGRESGTYTFHTWESDWERYTRQFIKTFNLTEDQTQHALSILEECQQRGRAYVAAHQEEIDAAQREMKRHAQGETKPDVQRSSRADRGRPEAAVTAPTSAHQRLEALREQVHQLIRPLDEIYAELRGRLDRIPTRAQREAVRAATSRPASAPSGG